MPEQDLAIAAEELADGLQGLSAQVAALRRQSRWWIGGLVLLVVAMGVTFMLASAAARAEDRENDRRWCALLDATTTPVPSGMPETPTTKRQRAILAELNTLRRDLGCI